MMCSERLFCCWVQFYYFVTKPYSCKCLFSTPQIHVATDAFTSTKCESQLVMLHLNLCNSGIQRYIFSIHTHSADSILGYFVLFFTFKDVPEHLTLNVSDSSNCSVLYFCWRGAQGWGEGCAEVERGGRAELLLGGGITVILLVLFIVTSCRLAKLC